MSKYLILKQYLPFLLMSGVIVFSLYFWFTKRVLAYVSFIRLNDD